MMSFLACILVSGVAITFTALVVWLVGTYVFKFLIINKPRSNPLRRRERKFKDISIVTVGIGVMIICLDLFGVIVFSAWQAL